VRRQKRVKKFDYLIIGNSVAAVGAIEAIREVDHKGSIAVISDEPHYAYSRPRISEYITQGRDASSVCYRTSDFYDKNSVQTILGVRVEQVNPGQKTVMLETGEHISYKKLLIATGSKPIAPPIKGIDLEGVYYFTTFKHVEELARNLKNVDRTVVIGGGLIGLQAAEALHKVGIQVTVVEKLERVLAQSVDKHASALVEARFIEHGIAILTSSSVEEILGENGTVSGVRLEGGMQIACQAVVVAVGVSPRKELAENAGLAVNKGIIVNDFMQTSDPDIYSAGDVVESLDITLDERRLLQIWPTAYAEGRAAGLAMAGKPVRYSGGMPLNATHFFGYPVVSAGLVGDFEGCLNIVDFDESSGFYRRLILKDGILIGMVMAGDAVDRAGIITALIRNKTNVSSFIDKLSDRCFNAAHMPQELRLEKQSGRD
jgi:NAD(P)H-nitrite reductase large subunit